MSTSERRQGWILIFDGEPRETVGVFMQLESAHAAAQAKWDAINRTIGEELDEVLWDGEDGYIEVGYREYLFELEETSVEVLL